MNTQQALLRAILLNPADDTARLVYADWLQENGDEKRAEFIRDTRANWPHVHKLWGEISSCIPTAKIAGFGVEETGLPRWTFNLPQLWGKAIYARGFVSEIHLPLAAFMEHAKALFSAHPIERVTLTDMRPEDLGYGYGWMNEPAGASEHSVPDELWHENNGSDDDTRWVRANPEDCVRALSLRCVAYGRSLAGLT